MQLLNQTELTAALGISAEVVIKLRKSGAITPAIKEGRNLIKYDLEQVKQQLQDRAKSNANSE